MFLVDRPSYLYSHPAPSHLEYYGHQNHPARGRLSYSDPTLAFGHGVDEWLPPHAREPVYHGRAMNRGFTGLEDYHPSDPWAAPRPDEFDGHTLSLAARLRHAEAEAASWRARAERAEHYSSVLRSQAESQAHFARRSTVRGRNSHDEIALSRLVDLLRSREQPRREQSLVNPHSRSRRISPMPEYQRPVQDAGLSEALQPLLNALETSLRNRSPGPRTNDTAPDDRLGAQASDPVQAVLGRLFGAHTPASDNLSRTFSPAPAAAPAHAAHAHVHTEQVAEGLKPIFELLTGSGPNRAEASSPADALASLLGSFTQPSSSSQLGQAGATPGSSSGPAPSPAPHDALASLISSLLGAQLGEHERPASSPSFAPAPSGSSSAGPSMPSTAADSDARIPFVAKGKWRADSAPSPAPTVKPTPATAEDEDVAERMAAQVAADAAFAAALQAEEDGRRRPARAHRISIREPGSDGGKVTPAPTMPALLEQLLGRAEHGGEMRDVVNNAVQALFPSTPMSSAARQATVSPTAGPSSRPASVGSSSSTSAPAAPSSPAPALTPLESIERIASSLHALVSSFTLPVALDFALGAKNSALGLAHTPANAPLHAHEAALARILDELDAVDAAGDERVRARRREVVREVEGALETLERAVRERRPLGAAGQREEDVKGYDVDSPAQPEPIKTTEASMRAETPSVASTLLAAAEDTAVKVESTEVDVVNNAESAGVDTPASAATLASADTPVSASHAGTVQDASAPSAISSSLTSTSSPLPRPSSPASSSLSEAISSMHPSPESIASSLPRSVATSDEEGVVVDAGAQADEAWSEVDA